MNITIDSQYSTPKAAGNDNSTTTYRASAAPQSRWGSGYSLDIADKVMDDKAYQGQGMTAADIMQQAQGTDAKAQKDFMLVMSNSVSEEDFEKMQKEGHDPGSTDVETYVSMVDQIKVTLAKAGVEIKGYNDDLDADVVEEITGSKVSANELIKKMTEADIPVTEENVEDIAEAFTKATNLTSLSEDTIKYMLLNKKAPTIDNLYLAQFSSADNLKQARGYYNDGTGYYAKKADSINWENLKGQIAEIVSQSGIEDTKHAVENAKWLVESGIELTVDNLTSLSDLKDIEFPLSENDITDMIVTALGNGKKAGQALVTGESDIASQAEQLVKDASAISDEAIKKTVESGKELNLKNLTSAQKEIDAANSEISANKQPLNSTDLQENNSDTSLKEIEAKRQLEEVRLIMTQEANQKLLRSGYQIDTTELSQLVDDLRAMENSMKAAIFKGETVEENNNMAAIYEDTLNKTNQLAYMPAAVVIKAAKLEGGSEEEPVTLNVLHKEGSILQKQYKAAGETYEALMTAPRKDLGDKISKAFRNINDILEDMGLETSDENRRAVRILGYNSIEITKENIDSVKSADSMVRNVINKMTPGVTLNMIREQKNPLEMSMDDLDNYLNEQNKDIGNDAQKFSKYLQKLDRKGEITEDEREAYIGIYRMFRQIEKSDGAVIGSIVAAGAQMNFKNMLSAVRTSAGKNMDIKIDNEYGALEKLITKGTAIDTQIQAGFNNNSGQSGAESKENFSENSSDNISKEKYYARLSGEIKDELADDSADGISISDLQNIEIKENTTIEHFSDEIKQKTNDNNVIKSGNTSKKTVNSDRNVISEQISKSDTARKVSNENLKSFREDLKEAREIEDAVIQSLIDYEQPVSVDNIQAISMLVMERGSMYRQIFSNAASGKNNTDNKDQTDDTISENVDSVNTAVQESQFESLLNASDKMIDSLTDKKSANESYKELVNQASKVVEDMIYKKGASVIDVKGAKALYKGLSLAGNLAREENYELPVNINGEFTSVNLKIYHNAARTGKVTVTMDTENFGKVAAEFDVTDKRISGMVAYEKSAIKSDLEAIVDNFENELSILQQENGSDRQINVSLVHSAKLDINKFGQDRELEDEGERLSTVELYKTAKAFMTAVKTAA